MRLGSRITASYRKKTGTILFVIVAGLALYLSVVGRVGKTLSESDVSAIARLSVNGVCSNLNSFRDEIGCVAAIQASIERLVPNHKCAPKHMTIEPYDFLQRGYGCCYDRARFIEKALLHYGFQTRHVALYDKDRYGLFALLLPGTASHASTEVKTRKGWMGADSIERFILITVDQEVLTYKHFMNNRDDLNLAVEPPVFYDRDLVVIYGLYSRHGMFHGVNLPSPEFDLRELLYNIWQ